MGEAKRRQQQDPSFGKYRPREYTAKDFNTVMGIYDDAIEKAHAFLEEKKREDERKLATGILENHPHLTWVIEHNNKIIGFASMLTLTRLAGMAVLSNDQSKGAGTALMNHLKSKTNLIQLVVYKENHEACRFYLDKCGFSTLKEDLDDKNLFFVMEWRRSA